MCVCVCVSKRVCQGELLHRREGLCLCYTQRSDSENDVAKHTHTHKHTQTKMSQNQLIQISFLFFGRTRAEMDKIDG